MLAIDGKALRGTIPGGETRGRYLMAAYLVGYGVVLAQVEVGCKENEIVAAPKLLAHLDLTGLVVVGDAMQCQRELSVKVVSKKGDFLSFLKENQPGAWAEVRDLFEAKEPLAADHSPSPNDFVTTSTVAKSHGRLEERLITVSSEMEGYLPWPHLKQVFKLERWTTVRGVTRREVWYGLTSLLKELASAKRLLAIARAEWGIENSLHYRRDVTLGEDASQLRRGNAPQANAVLNNIVLSLSGLGKVENVAAARRDLDYIINQQLLALAS